MAPPQATYDWPWAEAIVDEPMEPEESYPGAGEQLVESDQGAGGNWSPHPPDYCLTANDGRDPPGLRAQHFKPMYRKE